MTLRLALVLLLLSIFPLPPRNAAADEAEKVFEQNCTRCHNPEAIKDKLKDKRLNREGWTDVIERMKGYGAEAPKDKQAELIDYLMRTYGPAGVGEAPAAK